MYVIDLAPVQLPDAELHAAIALRESKVARLKEQMGAKYRLHPSNIIRRHVAIPNFLLKENGDG